MSFFYIGIRIEWTPIITFNDCLKLGVEEHVDAITSVAENASKEYSIEQILDKMIAEWAENLMELSPYKNTGNFSFFNLMWNIFEDQLNDLQNQTIQSRKLTLLD